MNASQLIHWGKIRFIWHYIDVHYTKPVKYYLTVLAAILLV